MYLEIIWNVEHNISDNNKIIYTLLFESLMTSHYSKSPVFMLWDYSRDDVQNIIVF
jgi:hypothetical protein